MASGTKALFTGGSGLLGKSIQRLRPKYLFPSSAEMNVADYGSVASYCGGNPVKTLIHAAAFTSPPKIDQDPLRALEANIIGTANVVKYCMLHDIRLVYISTDYVFRGDTGNYKEEDPLAPVNLYAWSKLGGECAARMHKKALVVRTTFGPEPFPYDKGFTDQWTSRQGVSEIARKIVRLAESGIEGVIHVGGERRTVYEYALSVAEGKEIGKLSIKDVSFSVPVDTSLDCSRYQKELGE
jgi:dTDP-4-dehydrorhamnose reductase